MESEIPTYLVGGFWRDYVEWTDKPLRHFDSHAHFGNDQTLTVNLTYLTGSARTWAEEAIDDWFKVIAWDYELINGPAQITLREDYSFDARQRTIYDDRDAEGPFNQIWSTTVIFTQLLKVVGEAAAKDVIVHEIGHTLGLGHPGSYNGDDGAPIFADDLSVNTVMSYSEDTFRANPGRYDVEAAQILYGVPDYVNQGDTIHFINPSQHYHVYDTDGADTAVIRAVEGGVYDFRPDAHTPEMSVQDDSRIERIEIHHDGNDFQITTVGGLTFGIENGEWFF